MNINRSVGFFAPQCVALGWENGRAFGPIPTVYLNIPLGVTEDII
jgi:hypothetical protein